MLRSWLVAGLAVLAAGAARADTPPWAGIWMGGSHPSDTSLPTVAYAMAGAADLPVARGLPFGLNRGTCDRSRVAAEAALAGGGDLAEGLDSHDRGCVAAALAYLPDARMIAWAGGDGLIHRVMPLRSWLSGGRPCREVEVATLGSGGIRRVHATACQDRAGRWAAAD